MALVVLVTFVIYVIKSAVIVRSPGTMIHGPMGHVPWDMLHGQIMYLMYSGWVNVWPGACIVSS